MLLFLNTIREKDMEQVKVVYSSEQIAEAIKKVADKIN